MHLLGNRMHALIGLWILAGLAVLGLNGYMLMSLLDEPLAGYSSQVRNADQSFRQYRMLLSAETEKINIGMQWLAKRFTPMDTQDEPAPPSVSDSVPVAKQTAAPPVVLPRLAGIMTSRSTDGTIRYLALMDGRVWAEGDQLQDLTVRQIASRGVTMARGDQSWFVKTPEIAHSVITQ